MTPLIQKAVRLAPQPETAMWFDVGLMEPLSESKSTPVEVLLRLPFRRTGIAGTDSNGRAFSLWMTAGENSVTIAGCLIDQVQFFKPFAYIKTDDGFGFTTMAKKSVASKITL